MPHQPTILQHGGVNAIGRMLGLLGDEWSLLILQQSLTGATRYRDFRLRLPISNSVLTNRLRELSAAGLLTPDGGGPGYLPTRRARSLWPVLVCIWEWERDWVDVHPGGLPTMRHQRCGQIFGPVLRCADCGRPADSADVQIDPGPSGDWARSAPLAVTRRRSGGRDPVGQAGLFPETMAVFGNRWSAALVVAALLGASRFTDFGTQLGVPPSLLAERLQTLCAIGVLRTAPKGPEPAAYVLTEKGRALFGVLVFAQQWGHAWFRAPEGPALVLTHQTCGAPFTAELGCGRCGQRLRGAEIGVIPLSPPAAAGSL